MPAAIDNFVKTNVIKHWLDGDTRDKIASNNQIGAGTVTGIINEWKKGVEALEYESVRELSISCKKQGINLGTLASSVRLNNYVQRLGANLEQIEAFIANLANSPEPKKLFDVANQIAQISMSESIPLDVLADHIKRQQYEKQRLEKEIEEAGALLKSKNIDIQTLNEHKKLKEELNVHCLSIQDPHILLSVLNTIRQIGYEPQKIVREFSRIKSLRQTERELNNSCKALESRLSRYREVLPMCEQIVRLRIRMGELLAFHTVVCEKAEMHNLSREGAAHRVIGDIRDYDKLGGLKKLLNDISMQIFMMNQISASQNYAVNALMKLQLYGKHCVLLSRWDMSGCLFEHFLLINCFIVLPIFLSIKIHSFSYPNITGFITTPKPRITPFKIILLILFFAALGVIPTAAAIFL
jgi:hypothetical protein